MQRLKIKIGIALFALFIAFTSLFGPDLYTEHLYTMGYNYAHDTKTPQHDVLAAKYFRKAAERGHAAAQKGLSDYYREGKGGLEKDEKAAAEWLTKAAINGDLIAAYNLGIAHLYGKGITKDGYLAMFWFSKAAKAGDVDAQTMLARMFFDGNGVRQNFEKAVEWARKAAEKGNVTAQNLLGIAYLKGLGGIQKDEKTAVKWFRKSAEQGHGPSAHNLGAAYLTGIGIPKDHIQALLWLTKAEEFGELDDEGYFDTKFKIASIYYLGMGITEDRVRATKILLDLAKKGYPPAQGMLSHCYSEGNGGLQQDNREAYFWALLASRASPYIKEKESGYHEKLNSSLTQEERSLITQRINEWKPEPVSTSKQ